MLQEVSKDIKGLVSKGLKISLIFILLTNPVVATSSCNSASAYPVYCSCDNGGSEKHTNAESFLEARKDVKSCCYYDSSNRNKIIDLGAYSPSDKIWVRPEPKVQVVEPVKPIESNEPEMRIIATSKAVDQSLVQYSPNEKFHRPKTLSFRSAYRLLEGYVQGTYPISKVIPMILRKNTIPLYI